MKLYIYEYTNIWEGNSGVGWFVGDDATDAKNQAYAHLAELMQADAREDYKIDGVQHIPQSLIDQVSSSGLTKEECQNMAGILHGVFDNSTLGDLPPIIKKLDSRRGA